MLLKKGETVVLEMPFPVLVTWLSPDHLLVTLVPLLVLTNLEIKSVPVPMIRNPSLPTCLTFLHLPPLSRATQVRPEAAEEGAVARQEETDSGTRTTKSPPSPHPTTPSPLLSTWWSTTPRATSATRCNTTGSSTRTRTRSCPRSWCPTCWRRTATLSPTRCPRWVDASRFTFLITNCTETEGRRRGNRVFIYCHVSSDAWQKNLWVNPSASYLPWQRISQSVKPSDMNTCWLLPHL